MASVLRAYNAFLQRRPVIGQCATSAVLFGASDIVAQQAVEKRGLAKHDYVRTLRSTFYGGCLFGPAVTKWFGFLNRLQFRTPRRAVIYRVYLDQFMFAPAIIAFYFGSMTIMEGKGVSEAVSRIEKAYVPTVLRNWMVFIPTQLVNFAFVPHHLRVLTVGIVSLFWNTYLSMVNNSSQAPAEDVEIEQAEMGALVKVPA
ncbi:Mpv17/PMP22 family protein [Phanerochaete sordida]|uniref:Mpv17/PMP22 family protein n=1 Tax=Phanerochaete sordida TaxID=48140 RepID=A0A9P3LCC8_9APHY|nr:Mpv17/PMP22 family protein [Phanerochaete sordida]